MTYHKTVRYSNEVEYPESSLVYVEIERSWDSSGSIAASGVDSADGAEFNRRADKQEGKDG